MKPHMVRYPYIRSKMYTRETVGGLVMLVASSVVTWSAVEGVPTPSSQQPAKIDVGAVRWDAWFGYPTGQDGIVSRTVTMDLSPERFHYRLPFFAKEHAYDPATNSTVTINGNTEGVMTAEINYASEFGIDFWAFCAYPIGCKDYATPVADCPKIQCCADNYALSYALNLYLTNPNNHKSTNWYPSASHGGNETVEQEADRFVSYFQMPNHQRCCGNRPVVYFFGAKSPDAVAAMEILRTKAKAALGVEPYYVDMAGSPSQAKSLNMDAVSRYVVQQNPHSLAGAPYSTSIAQPEAAFWESTKDANFSLIPPISPGWDPSPREYIDLPWGDQGHTACVIALGHPCYVQDPTMAELTAHTRAAVEFALANPTIVEASAVIIGAWNENDEGHWIVPSLYNGTQKLEAVQKGVHEAYESYTQA